jgi:hypothetical protein
MASKIFGSAKPSRSHLANRVGKGGLGEIKKLRDDVEASFSRMESSGGSIRTDEYTNPAAADTDAIKTAAATAATAQSFSAAAGDFDGVIGDAEMIPPRPISITTTADADVDAVDVVVTGAVRLADGTLQDVTDTITLTDDGGVTDAGTIPMSFLYSADVPAQGGAGATLAIGFAAPMGLSDKVMERAGLITALQQIVAGAVVTTGTITNPAGSPVSVYAPASVADGARDYAVTYVVEASA